MTPREHHTLPLRPQRENNFDAIRLAAALAVLVGHAWPLTGEPGSPVLAGIQVFTLAVYVFFALSGYLVATSWARSPRPASFLLRRAGRIFPALIVVVVSTVFLIGPAVTVVSARDYFSSAATWSYLTNITLIASYDLPGVFGGHPRPVVNGVLWTLGPEFISYLGVLAVGVATSRLGRGGQRLSAAIFALLAVILSIASMVPLDELDAVRPAARAMVFFAIGALYAQLPNRSFRAAPAALGLLAWLSISAAFPGGSLMIAWLVLPYAVISFGSRHTPVVRRAGRFGDISYGIYLWGFPVQQVVWLLAPDIPLSLNIVLVVLLTACIAAISWRVVEEPFLKRARRFASQLAERDDYRQPREQ